MTKKLSHSITAKSKEHQAVGLTSSVCCESFVTLERLGEVSSKVVFVLITTFEMVVVSVEVSKPVQCDCAVVEAPNKVGSVRALAVPLNRPVLGLFATSSRFFRHYAKMM